MATGTKELVELCELYNATKRCDAVPYPDIGNSKFSSLKLLVNMLFVKINQLESEVGGNGQRHLGPRIVGCPQTKNHSPPEDPPEEDSSPTNSNDCLFSWANLEKVCANNKRIESPYISAKKLKTSSSPKDSASPSSILTRDYNKVPTSHNHNAYKPLKVPTKRLERKKLQRQYYLAKKGDSTDPRGQGPMQERARPRYFENKNGTPHDFWGADFPNTQECLDKGFLGIGRESQRYN